MQIQYSTIHKKMQVGVAIIVLFLCNEGMPVQIYRSYGMIIHIKLWSSYEITPPPHVKSPAT